MEGRSITTNVDATHTLIRLAALAAVAFYVGTAHLTKGHEADFGKQWLAARMVPRWARTME